MTAPHFHTTKEARAAIKSIEKNPISGEAKAGGSSSNQTTSTPRVTEKSKGQDWVNSRKP